MTPDDVARKYEAHRVGDGHWRARCPAHDGRSDNSLSIRSTNDGKTLLKCWGGCLTPEVLNAGGLDWADLFPPSSAFLPHRRIDPKVEFQRRAERELRECKEKPSRIIGYRIWLRHRLVAKGEQLIDSGRKERGWDLLKLGYLGLSRLSWISDLLGSKNREDLEEARAFWGAES